ncbi:MAG: hypothetical protein RR667_01775 [Muribaculaceae bacterium]
METLLEGVSDTLQYAGVKLNNAYGFKINKATTYVVIGENGCGKYNRERLEHSHERNCW